MKVKTEYPEDTTYRRLDAGVTIGIAIIILLILGWIIIPLYTAGYVGEKLNLIEYIEKGDSNF